MVNLVSGIKTNDM